MWMRAVVCGIGAGIWSQRPVEAGGRGKLRVSLSSDVVREGARVAASPCHSCHAATSKLPLSHRASKSHMKIVNFEILRYSADDRRSVTMVVY